MKYDHEYRNRILSNRVLLCSRVTHVSSLSEHTAVDDRELISTAVLVSVDSIHVM